MDKWIIPKFLLYFLNFIMPLQRSTEDISLAVGACGTDPICSLCKHVITSSADRMTTVCGHVFHKPCITHFVKTNSLCPVCQAKITKDSSPSTTLTSHKTNSPMTTRSAAKAKSYDSNRPSEAVSEIDRGTLNNKSELNLFNSNPTGEYIKQVVSSAVSEQQSQMLSTLTREMSKLVEQSMAAGFSSLGLVNIPQLNINTSSPSANRNPVMQSLPDVEQRTLEQLLGLSSNQNPRPNTGFVNEFGTSGNANRSQTSTSHTVSDLVFRPDRVSQIIYNWKLRFAGNSKSLPVESFIYRVEALTKQTLSGNFTILCMNASALFDDRAADWFWRFHKSFPNFQWTDLCKALKEQYRDSRRDVDLRELIRDRKQKPGETFDSFYESVVEIVDRLDQPLPDRTLVEILRRNLLPEIQHEILNMSIFSIAELRDICRRREFFLQDMRKRHGISSGKPSPFQKRISEVDVMEEPGVEMSHLEEVSEINLICWNCRKSGHRYQDCLTDRNIFCYGCGAPEIYKPNCKTCSTKNSQATAPKGATKTSSRQ